MSKFQTVADYAGADGWSYDPWGTAALLAFDICAVLDAADIEGDITPEPFAQWEYRRGAHAVPSLETLAGEGGDSYGEQSLAQAILDGDLTPDDLIYAGNVIDRYMALLTAAGRDY